MIKSQPFVTPDMVINKVIIYHKFCHFCSKHILWLLIAIASLSTHNVCFGANTTKIIWAQLFKTNDVISLCILKTLIIKYGIYTNIFAKNLSSFCICKSYSHFFGKNTCELDIVLNRTVNILTTNKLVKLTML